LLVGAREWLMTAPLPSLTSRRTPCTEVERSNSLPGDSGLDGSR
jgi:hypothetical protein